jgi:hypothetical protein
MSASRMGRKASYDLAEPMLENLNGIDVSAFINRDLNAITVEERLGVTRRNKGVFVLTVFKKKKGKALMVFINRCLELNCLAVTGLMLSGPTSRLIRASGSLFALAVEAIRAIGAKFLAMTSVAIRVATLLATASLKATIATRRAPFIRKASIVGLKPF